MVDFSDARGFRKTVAGVCMLAAPAFLAVGEFIHPQLETEAAAQLEVLRDNADRQYAAHILFVVSLILMIPALLGLMHHVEGAASRLGSRRRGPHNRRLDRPRGLHRHRIRHVADRKGCRGRRGCDDSSARSTQRERRDPAARPARNDVLLVLGIGLWLARPAARWEAVLVAVAPLLTLASEFSAGPRFVTVGGCCSVLHRARVNRMAGPHILR